jgi:hypothetical protein
MAMGRLVRVRNSRSNQAAIIYVVAETSGAAAIDALEKALAHHRSEYQDLVRVNDSLIAALQLKPGQFPRL